MSPVTGARVPLLPDSKGGVPPATVSGAVFNVANSIIGAGIMSLPATLKVLGVIPALVLILVIAFLAELSVEFLMRFTRAGQTTTYAGVMREAFGPVGAVAAQIAVGFTNMGCLIMYLIIAESLKFSSAISTFLAVAFVTTCTVLAIIAIVEGRTQSPKLIPHLDEQTTFFDLFTAVPVIVTAYTFHFNVHPIGFELANASDMTTAVRLALLLCAAIYFSIGLFGYLLFGDSTQSDILVNFDQNTGSAVGSLLNVLVRLSYGLHVILTFPVLNFSLRTNIDEFLFSKKPLLATDSKRFVSLTVVLLVLSYLAAVAVPDIWYIFQFVGSTSTVCLSFVFPGAIVLRDLYGIATRRDKIIALFMVILAAITSVIAISTNIYKAFQ
ncbi:amino acid transporter AVT6C isoform X2 [Vigna angularis]|uniref:amino acid transporter AVT6C isoform X2 n=1 Tax=Phaseolus angularis TaxID=3914 RepID=UPI0022B3A4F7|nr:amino acid transporter AVT6C isoform X2 [Vigna angularis]